ncbi:MAG: family 14 glycosylhydrolase [Armatimonadetes bacterium]|nr:family 14 glycosylhydrolase [Armatimonadota bacterium]MCX7776526.1 family 14 glycosylhydrolase [Armatimonadota bacterium]
MHFSGECERSQTCSIRWMAAAMLMLIWACAMIMHAISLRDEPTAAVHAIVKLPAELESATKLASMLKEFNQSGLKVEGIGEFELSMNEDVQTATTMLNKISEVMHHSRQLGVACAILVSIAELPKLVGEELPKSMFATTGKALESPSIFAPQTMRACAKAIKLLSKHFANLVDVVTVSMPQLAAQNLNASKFGRTMLYDFLCGDDYAKLSFMQHLKARYLALNALNRAWGTKYNSWGEISYPMERSNEDWIDSPYGMRRHWVDFINWYGLANAKFVSQLLHQMREAFTQSKLCISIPTSITPPASWLITAPVRAISAHYNAFIRVDASMPLLNAALLSSSCELYKVNSVCNLRFNDAIHGERSNIALHGSNAIGAQAFIVALLQPEMLAVSIEELRRLLQMFLDGELVVPKRAHLTDVALLLPSTSLAIEPALQGDFAKCMMSLYDVLPCDLVDEQLVCDGAIEDYRLLVAPIGSTFSEPLLKRVSSWVERGGLLLIGSDEVWTDLHGSSDIGKRLLTNDAFVHRETLKTLSHAFSNAAKVMDAPNEAIKEIFLTSAKHVGDGIVIWLPITAIGERGFSLVAADVALNISGCAPMTRRAISPFNMWRELVNLSKIDGVIALWYGDFVTLLNASRLTSALSVQTGVGEIRRKLAPLEFSSITVRTK